MGGWKVLAMNKNFIKFLILIVSSFLASQIQSSWGDVNVQAIKIPTHNGQWVVADLFKPYSATSNNQAPAVIVIPDLLTPGIKDKT